MKKIITIAATSILFLSACPKLAEQTNWNPQSQGHEQGNGTDRPPTGFDSAWLVGEEKIITYCVEIAPDFGAEAKDIYNSIEQSFDLWKNYIIDKNVNDRLEADAKHSLSYYPDLLAQSKAITLPIKRQLNTVCIGNETIKFSFGTEDTNIIAVKKNYFDAVGFAHRNKYDIETGVGSGVIWLTKKRPVPTKNEYFPDWSLPNRLQGILTHELGHFYGIGHIKGTIMQESMYSLLFNHKRDQNDLLKQEFELSHIDGAGELLFTNTDQHPKRYSGKMAFPIVETSDDAAENFQFITGRKSQGPIMSKFLNNKIYISDQISESVFDLSFDDNHGISREINYVFNIFRTLNHPDDSGALTFMTRLEHTEVITSGQIVISEDKKIPILFYYNMGYTPLKITFLVDGKQRALLMMDYLYF